MASSKLGNALIAMLIKTNQESFKRQGVSPANLVKINRLGDYGARSVSSANNNLFTKAELGMATPKKTAAIATAPVSQSKRQRTAGAQLLKRRKRPQGKVRRPKASTIPITKENQLG